MSQSSLQLPVVISEVSNKVNSSNWKKRGEYQNARTPEVFLQLNVIANHALPTKDSNILQNYGMDQGGTLYTVKAI